MTAQTIATPRILTSQTVCDSLAPLEAGDHLSQKEFHARYELMPEKVKAELVEGIVYMQSPLKRTHGRYHSLLVRWLGIYEDATPGVEAYDNATTIMGDESEPQPDACLLIVPEKGGQARFTDEDYLEGAPEFIGEIASSSESFDLHSKKRDYERAGVKEYLVYASRQKKIHWFILGASGFEELALSADGYFHSRVFPGLWLDPQAFTVLDGNRLMGCLTLGLSTTEHGEFVLQLNRLPSK